MTNLIPVTIGESSYAKNAVKYIEILNKLRSIGAQSTIDLPTVVFCGNQSAGKSSLLEAISGIQLPRSEGTCTRCVMEIRLIQFSGDWSCQVSLRKEYDANEEKLIRPEEVKFGKIITNPNNVEIVARRAQKALLNPNCKPEDYFNYDFENLSYEDDAAKNSLKFTKNVVCLEIKGPKVPNLSLIDLPGIIRHVEKEEDRRFIRLIEELVENYISKEKSIIVATISCKDEIDNQAIVTLAKKADKQGLRTLGVLTKPDTIEEGTHHIWVKIMRGDAHNLALGYYVVRNPKPIELKDRITFDEARRNEKKFFEEEEPWRSFHLRERLGVDHLQKKLSDLLIHAIKRNLPSIKKEIEDKLEKIQYELDQIPEQLGENPRIELFRMTKKCANSIREENTEKYIDFINEVEGGDFPFTLDEGSMILLKNEYFKKFQEATTPQTSQKEVSVNENQKPLDTLEIMASAMAYFKLSFKRYADIVSITIIHAFIDNFSKAIEEKFLEACDPMEGEEDFKLDELVREDENISGKRDNLLETEKHLRSMLVSLVRFGC
ncbi:P-loop containing nucleoside triphosphate hydrolase protein [Glomus cerebriforme]|uniref:P-loop containing nucleoside triphosphate hydrolase protein n=1 Tax=Glomus cerebriforme TaxID=658196 RepID=A0A397TLG6_9GLOM|nr:P-loop containing nucleoside triphosphate hydrolase protein [Glomus cerebriforme]